VDFASRYWSPWNGVDEDPVNGSSHTALTPLWAKLLGKSKLSAEMMSPRGGVLNVEFCESENVVMLGGPCALVMDGKFRLPPPQTSV
jgi:predicted PhzF superfamily epimerase YddE/YHI9